MTGADLAAIERLPDTTGLKRRGADPDRPHGLSTARRSTRRSAWPGAKVVPVGQATYARRYQLDGAIDRAHGGRGLRRLPPHRAVRPDRRSTSSAAICHAQGVPVIVDAASEYDLKGFLAEGADARALLRAQIPGRADRRHRRRAQGPGSRGLSAERRHRPGHEGRQGRHRRHHRRARGLGRARPRRHPRARDRPSRACGVERLAGSPGVRATMVPDPTDNPLDRLQVEIDARRRGITAWDLTARSPPATRR